MDKWSRGMFLAFLNVNKAQNVDVIWSYVYNSDKAGHVKIYSGITVVMNKILNVLLQALMLLKVVAFSSS